MAFILRRTDTDEPVKPIKAITPQQLLILRLLDPFLAFQNLTIPWLVEFTGGNHTAVRKTLRLMSKPPNNYLVRPKEQWNTVNVDAKTFIFSIGERGFQELLKRGFAYPHSEHKSGRQLPNTRHRSNSFWHECGVDMNYYAPALYHAMHSEGQWNLIDFATLYEMKYPDKDESDADPFPVKLSKATLRFDGTPHVIEYGGRHTCIPGIQYDTGARSMRHLETQLDEAMEYMRKKKHTEMFDFQNAMIPFVFTKPDRRKKAKAYLEKEYGSSRAILLGLAPDLSHIAFYPQPNDDIIMTPWQRAGAPDYSLATLSDVIL